MPLDTPSVYGLSKGFGELICQYFARWFGMNLIALRITGPGPAQQYLEQRRNPRPDPPGTSIGERIFVTDEEDLAEAYHLALEKVQQGHGRFEAVYIAGDEREQVHNLSKARQSPLGGLPGDSDSWNRERRVAPSLSPQSMETQKGAA